MKRFLVTFALLIFSSSGFAASYFVTDVTSDDAGPDITKSAKTLIITAVTNLGANLAPAEASADYVLRPSIVRLGHAYVLTVAKVKNGAVVGSAQQKAMSAEELDDASNRAVRAVMLDTQTKPDLRVGEVKRREEDQLRRRILSRNTTYLGFGPGSLQNLGYSKLAYDFGIGRYWEVTPQSMIKLVGNGVLSGNWKVYYFSALLGLNYFLSDQDAAPYLTAGFGYGFSGSGKSTPATAIGGFAMDVGAGLQLFRTSSTQFDISLVYSLIFGNNTIGTPGFTAVRLGVLF
jgi:hypothetical protein